MEMLFAVCRFDRVNSAPATSQTGDLTMRTRNQLPKLDELRKTQLISTQSTQINETRPTVDSMRTDVLPWVLDDKIWHDRIQTDEPVRHQGSIVRDLVDGDRVLKVVNLLIGEAITNLRVSTAQDRITEQLERATFRVTMSPLNPVSAYVNHGLELFARLIVDAHQKGRHFTSLAASTKISTCE